MEKTKCQEETSRTAYLYRSFVKLAPELDGVDVVALFDDLYGAGAIEDDTIEQYRYLG